MRARASSAAATALALIALGSCTSALSLDGYQDASGSICGLLATCDAAGRFSACQPHVNGDLQDADAGARDGWLTTLSTQGCLDTCSTARLCLDQEPVCAPNGAACTQAEECCGFTSGSGDCDARARRCCSTQGQRCADDSQCCESAGVCDPGTHTCGGTICRAPGTACQIDQQCCTLSCLPTGCAAKTCKDDGFDCKGGAECCSAFCNAGGRCAEPLCLDEGQPCRSAADCCSGLTCYSLGAVGFCSPGACTPRQVGCMSDDQCCTHHCDPTYDVCADACVAAGAACQHGSACCSGKCGQDGTCAAVCSDAGCSADGDCCSGTCIAGTCTPACGTAVCSHDVCQVGGPLAPGCPGATADACLAEICKNDSYCCCNAWDSFCVGEAMAQHALPGSACAGASCDASNP